MIRKVWLFFLALVTAVLPFVFRLFNGVRALPGFEPYYHLVAGTKGSLFFGARYVWEPYHFVVKWCFHLFGSVLFLPVFFSLVSFVLFWMVLRGLKIDDSVVAWSLVVFALSPAFISAGFFASRAGFVLFCLLLGVVCLLHRLHWLGVVLFSGAGLSGWVAWLGALSYVLFLMLVRPFLKKWCWIILGVLFAILVLFPFPPFDNGVSGISGFLGDLGGVYGISVFVLLLVVISAVVLWSHKVRYYSMFALVLALFVACLFYSGLFVYVNVFASALAGFSLSWLWRREWDLRYLRDISLLVLFCGILFSSVSHAVLLADSAPSDAFFDVLDVDAGVVLTHPSYGFWLEYAGFPVIADPFVSYLPDAESRMASIEAAFDTNDLSVLKGIIDEYGVSYVLITSEMTDGLVWEGEGSGLAFLVHNPETFKMVRDEDVGGLWRVR